MQDYLEDLLDQPLLVGSTDSDMDDWLDECADV